MQTILNNVKNTAFLQVPEPGRPEPRADPDPAQPERPRGPAHLRPSLRGPDLREPAHRHGRPAHGRRGRRGDAHGRASADQGRVVARAPAPRAPGRPGVRRRRGRLEIPARLREAPRVGPPLGVHAPAGAQRRRGRDAEGPAERHPVAGHQQVAGGAPRDGLSQEGLRGLPDRGAVDPVCLDFSVVSLCLEVAGVKGQQLFLFNV